MKTYRVMDYCRNTAFESPPSAALVAASLAGGIVGGAVYAECVDSEWRPLALRDVDTRRRYGGVVAVVYVEEVPAKDDAFAEGEGTPVAKLHNFDVSPF